MRNISLDAASRGITLKDMFLERTKDNPLLSKKEVVESLNPENYLGATDQIIERVIKKLERK
jgi:adenylosuccinate lyase